MEIKGKILDSTDQPLDLANITIISGTEKGKFGTSTNEKGEFSLNSNIINPDSEFVISYLGYKSQYFKASELQGKTIKLQEDAIALDELILRPQDKPNNITVANQSNSVKQYLTNHKKVFTGLGIVVGLSLIVTSINKLK